MAWLSGWKKRIELTIDNTNVDATLTNFPVMVKLSAASGIGDVDASAYFDELGSDANRKKIAITSSDGTTQLYVEIERHDDANEEAWLHTKAPSVTSGSTTTLYLYYDSDHADNTSYIGDTTDAVTHNVWDSDFCYDDITEILTEDGWKLFKDLDQTEKVATLNQSTQEIEYKKPYRYISYDYSGDLIAIQKSQQLSLAVIPDHNMYVSERKSNWSKYNLRKAKDIFDIPVKYKKDGCWVGEKQGIFILPSVIHEYGTTNQYSIGPTKEKRIPEIAINMNAWVEFLGYFLSEGYTIYHGKGVKRKYAVTIAQSLVHPEHRNRMRACLQKLPFKFHESDQGFTINNKQLATYTKQFGKDSERYIPKYIKKLHKSQLKILFDALMLGDGAAIGTSYSTISKKLADDFQELLLKIGTAGNVYKYSNGRKTPIYTISVITGQKFGQLQPYVWNRDKTGRTACHEIIPYNGKVYSVEVPNHIIYVRRNGKGVWSGNCGVWHMAQDPNGDVADAIKDSTSNANDCTPAGSMATADLVDGKAGKGINFDGSDDKVQLTDISDFDSGTGTISFIAKADSDDGNLHVPLAISNSASSIRSEFTWIFDFSAGDDRMSTILRSDTNIQWGFRTAPDYIDPYVGAWVHCTIAHNGTAPSFYVDGTSMPGAFNYETDKTKWIDDIIAAAHTADIFSIGANQRDILNNPFAGIVDEVRISSTARSAAWIKATYHSLWDSLITFGTEETDEPIITATPFTGTFELTNPSVFIINPLVTVIATPFTGTFSLTGGGVVVISNQIGAVPFTLTGTLSTPAAHVIPRTLFNSTLRLINSLKLGSTQTLVNSLNAVIESDISLVLNILSKIEGNQTLKLNVEEFAKFNDTLSLINHVLDADSGITQGDYYFLKSHGL